MQYTNYFKSVNYKYKRKKKTISKFTKLTIILKKVFLQLKILN